MKDKIIEIIKRRTDGNYLLTDEDIDKIAEEMIADAQQRYEKAVEYYKNRLGHYTKYADRSLQIAAGLKEGDEE